MLSATRLSTQLLVAAGLLVALNACSSDADPASGNGTEATVAPTDDSGSPPTGDGATGGSTTGDTSTVSPEGTGPTGTQSEESIEEYYRKLGVEQPVIDCYLDALDELGVTSLNQLEDDQALGIEAADRFDTCVADTTG